MITITLFEHCIGIKNRIQSNISLNHKYDICRMPKSYMIRFMSLYKLFYFKIK